MKKSQTPKYPSFTFRLSASERDKLKGEIELTVVHLNKSVREGDPRFSEGGVILDALMNGLKELRKKKQ